MDPPDAGAAAIGTIFDHLKIYSQVSIFSIYDSSGLRIQMTT
jgi:hypothetical protein